MPASSNRQSNNPSRCPKELDQHRLVPSIISTLLNVPLADASAKVFVSTLPSTVGKALPAAWRAVELAMIVATDRLRRHVTVCEVQSFIADSGCGLWMMLAVRC